MIKRTMIFIYVALNLLLFSALAHTPEEIRVNYDSKTSQLHLYIKHKVTNRNEHVISRIEVIRGDELIASREYRIQKYFVCQLAKIQLEDVLPGDELLIRAYCNIYGYLEKKFTIESELGGIVLKDGTYTTKNSILKVGLQVKDGKIAHVKIADISEQVNPYLDKIQPLADKVVEIQGPDVDVITGATITSESFRKAVRRAIRKALK